jgi:predicted LPLAT superfamily acyltransferase
MVALRERGVGALMLGSHLGSFEAMRALGDAKSFPVHIVAHFDNSQKLHRVLGENVGARIIVPDASDMSFVLKLREVIDRGELVAILADRYLEGNRTIAVDVLGRPAQLPVGPYLVAAALKCPVYVCFALHTGHARYAVAVEKLADRIELPRRARDEALRRYVQEYADKLSEYARRAPDNWFNFYDFWESDR